MIRAVLDTNVLISALLFSGPTAALVPAWQEGGVLILLSRETFQEMIRALAYPKFRLTEREVQRLAMDQVFRFADFVEGTKNPDIRLSDPDDLPFIACALAGKARFLVTGDRGLLVLGRHHSVEIIPPAEFIRRL